MRAPPRPSQARAKCLVAEQGYDRRVSGQIQQATELLRRTPDVLRALLAGLPETWTSTPDTADGWRPHDVVGHLITGEQADWLARTERILDHGTSKEFDRFD